MPRSWRRLTAVLQASGEDVVEMTFDEVAGVVGDVPRSQMENPAWWTDAPDRQRTKAWLAAGYTIDAVDPARGVVRFKRV